MVEKRQEEERGNKKTVSGRGTSVGLGVKLLEEGLVQVVHVPLEVGEIIPNASIKGERTTQQKEREEEEEETDLV